MESYKNCLVFYAVDTHSWRNWLEENHLSIKAVFLIIYHKNCGIQSITYDEAVDEALCFGWVDSKINKRDAQSCYQYFAKRNPKSNWSRVNKIKVENLQAQGRMAAAGIEMVQVAKETGTWSALDNVENLLIPEDMMVSFESNEEALKHWEAFSRSSKRGILEWIFTAKKPETRQDRIKITIEMAAKNKRINFDLPE